MSIVIREARLQDLKSIYDIAKNNQLNETGIYENGFLVSAYSLETYTNFYRNGNTILVIEKNHQIVGFLLTFLSEELDNGVLANQIMKKHAHKPFAVIKQVCIKIGHQNRGYGKMLYHHFVNHVFRDVYLAVVTEPLNEASIAFHNNLGFEKVESFKGEDEINRDIYLKRENEVLIGDSNLLIQQYQQAVTLYMHEDTLNWSKLNHLFYITAGLFGVFTYAINSPIERYVMSFILFLVSFLGVVSSFLFYNTVKSGIAYMEKRKEAVIAIEKSLSTQGGTFVVGRNLYKNSRMKQSLTSRVMENLPLMIMCIWLLIMILMIILGFKMFFDSGI